MKRIAALAMLLALAACNDERPAASPSAQAPKSERPVDLKRPGSINQRAGTDIPLAVGCRALDVVRYVMRSPTLSQAGGTCRAVGRL